MQLAKRGSAARRWLRAASISPVAVNGFEMVVGEGFDEGSGSGLGFLLVMRVVRRIFRARKEILEEESESFGFE